MNLSLVISAQDNASAVVGQIGSAISQLASGNYLGAITTAATAVGTALVGLGTQATQMAGDFQAATTTLVTGAGESATAVRDSAGNIVGGLDMVRQGILALSVQTGTSTQQLIDGMYMIESAGFHGAQGLQILQAAAEGAKVGSADLGTVANAVTTVMHDYAGSNFTAVQATNALITTVSDGKTHMQDLSNSLSTVLPLASSLHIPFEQVAGAIATMTNAGVPAQRATQNLAFAIRALDVESGPGSKALAAIGLSANQLHNVLVNQGLPAALQLVEDHIGKKWPLSSAEGQAALKAIMGGAAGLNVALMVGGKNMKEYKGDIDQIAAALKSGSKDVQGWDKVQQDFNFKLSQAQQAVNALMIKLGTALLPVVGKVVDWVTKLVLAFLDWETRTHGIENAIATLGQWWNQLWTSLQQIWNFLVSSFTPVWQQLVNTYQTQVQPAIADLINHIKPITPELQTIGGFIVNVLIKNLVWLLQTGIIIFGGLVQTVSGALQFLGAYLAFFVDLFTGQWGKLGDDLSTMAHGWITMFQGVWTGIVAVFGNAINGLIDMVNSWISSTVGPINAVITAMGGKAISAPQIPHIPIPQVGGGGGGQGKGAQGAQSKQGGAAPSDNQFLALLNALNQQSNTLQQLPTTNNLNQSLANTPTPTTAATTTGHAKTAAQIQKAADAANAQRLRLAASQQKALSTSSSSAVQKLVDQSKAAQAAGNTATASFYAQQANQLANQQHAAAQRKARQAQAAAHHAAVLAAQATRHAAATKRHQDIVAAAAARHKAAQAAAAARHAARLAQATSHHKQLISTILDTSQCAQATAITSAAGVALPDYATGTGYVTANAPAASATAAQTPVISNVTVHVHSADKDAKKHGKEIAEIAKKELAKHLRQQGIAPRYTSGGTH